jgi:type IV pilus assembly protein PilM
VLLPDAPVSIDIGSFSVKVAQVRGGRAGVRTIRYAEQALPPRFHWEPGGDAAPLVEAIRLALRAAGIRSRRAVVALPRRHVTARISAFPPADRAQLASVVQYDLADHIPFPVDQVAIDSQPLGPSVEQPGMVDVLVVAAPRELVQQYMQVVRAAGLRVTALTVDALALHDLAALRGDEPAGISVALEVGRRAATINVSMRGRLLLTRSVPAGGQQLTAAIRDDLGLSAEEAEARRQSEGLRLLERQPELSRVGAWLENLRGEIRRSALSFGQAALSRISVVGAGATIPGLVEALEESFGIRPMVLTPAAVFPTAQLRGPDGGAASRCMLAIGEALRGIGRSRFTISLVPRDVLAAQRATVRRRVSALLSVAMVAAVAFSYFSASASVQHGTEVKGEREKALEARDKKTGKVVAATDECRGLEEDVQALQPVQASRYQALELLRSITEGASGQIILSSFHLRPEQPLLIRGTAPDFTTAADLQAYLQKSPLVTSITLDRIDRPRTPGLPARRSGRVSQPSAEAEAPAGGRVSFAMTIHLWTEAAAKTKRRTTVRRPGEALP